ncbi:MAG TPA: leucyl aminopeptidase [Thermoanaerobaculia bacterium]|nr:leucyl aminopeptidase [Thermoanaerobaculia bacterium]
MQITISSDPKPSGIANLFVLVAEGDRRPDLPLGKKLRERVDDAIASIGFEGRAEQVVSLAGEGEPKKITLVGIGRRAAVSRRVLRTAIQVVGKIARKNRDASIALVSPYLIPGTDARETTLFLADRLAHADYRFDPYKTGEEGRRFDIGATLIPPKPIDGREAKRLLDRARILADSVRLVRDLGNAPGNELTPAVLAQRAQAVAKESGLSCTIWDKKQIEKMKMGGLLAVNRGSNEEPRFITLEWSPRKAKKTVCLVGKGITFDSGGISIKPSDKMEEMKFDMSGAGTVIGAMRAAALLEIPVRVVGLIPSTENLPSGSAYKPGDIITTMSGKTVEIVNTDAEGRMILCDALHVAKRYEPDHLIDFATLTGACVVALGNEASGLFSNDDELARMLIEAAEKAGEPAWRLPEWDDYKELIRSEWADMKNSGGRWGGAISAAVFLKQFVECPSWAHVDIAGTAYTENENARDPRGATGVGVRMAIRFLEAIA